MKRVHRREAVPLRLAPRHLRGAPWSAAETARGPGSLAAEDGNALVEFVVLSAALLIPSLYLVLTLGNVQAAVFAADTISRDVARIHATEPDPGRAAERAARHSAMVLEDHGLPAQDVAQVSCSDDPCATSGGTVTAQVEVAVPVPGLGPILGGAGPVAVGASHAVPVDLYREDL
ncbi:hypothetical protein [Brachybacterium sp. YJGR34]|uniref:hypothetical protein n=1 Tax=Brachybacterium sp. YJGR34 TaxID=2059911 RepID=UPI001E452C26|nr:hypothetical protein [Brachybacterium sp. YJGR34]